MTHHAAKPKDRQAFLQRAEHRFDLYHDTDTRLWLLLFAWAGMPVVKDEEMAPAEKQADPGVLELLKEIHDELERPRHNLTLPRHERALFLLLQRWSRELPYWPEAGAYGFIKAFRQTDVTSDGQTDMAIWHLLNGSKVVWGVIEKHFERVAPPAKAA